MFKKLNSPVYKFGYNKHAITYFTKRLHNANIHTHARSYTHTHAHTLYVHKISYTETRIHYDNHLAI